MKNMYAIGDMSKIHNVPIRTLRYYDKIGLFKPIFVDQGTGYRYYSTAQFEQLNIIKYLKFLGLPLKQIQKHLASRDAQHFLDLLKKQRAITEKTILELQLICSQFSSRIDEIEKALHADVLEQPILRYIPRRNIVSIDEPVSSEAEWELVLSKLQRQLSGIPSLFIGKVGFTVSLNNLLNKKFDEYSSVFILQDEAMIASESAKYLDRGMYACIFFRGNHDIAPAYYEQLLQFINSHGYEVNGDSIERIIIDDYISNNKELHLTEIQIPVYVHDTVSKD
jgi:DNA-binding transcriptional MerR regulator/effector-binding domain-containing protein